MILVAILSPTMLYWSNKAGYDNGNVARCCGALGAVLPVAAGTACCQWCRGLPVLPS